MECSFRNTAGVAPYNPIVLYLVMLQSKAFVDAPSRLLPGCCEGRFDCRRYSVVGWPHNSNGV
jgi:hypothetical protein